MTDSRRLGLGINVVHDARGVAGRERWPSCWPADVTILARDYHMATDGIQTRGYHAPA